MSANRDAPRLMVFDLSRHVHLPSYIRYLIEFWRRHDLAGTVTFVVWGAFLTSHADIVQLGAGAPGGGIQFVAPTPAEQAEKLRREKSATGVAIPFHDLLKAGAEADYAALYDWELLSRYAAALGATHSFIVHLDQYLPLLAAGLPAPSPLSGVYFGPTFHYAELGLAPATPSGPREKFVLARALRHPDLQTLFTLDRFAAERAARFPGGERVAFLPDPVRLARPLPGQTAALRVALGIQPGRRVGLLFGQLEARKGVEALLAAVEHLTNDECRRLCLLLVGGVFPRYQAVIERESAQVTAARPVQIVTRFGYAPDAEVPALFDLADVVLAPYPRHAGMSGILLLAAAASRPVIASSYGLMGEVTRRYRLGLTVDTTQPASIAAALRRVVDDDLTTLADVLLMRQLAEEHEADGFAAAIFERVGFML